MASNVIDSMVLELGLDASKFAQPLKDALASLAKAKEEAEKGGKSVEAQGKKFEDFFGKLKREAIGLLGAFMGARGLKDFVTNTVAIDAAVGRLSKTLNMDTKELSAWMGVARQTGGTAEGMGNAMQSLTDDLNKFALTGNSAVLPLLNAIEQGGISLYDANHNLKTAGQLFFEINAAVQKMDAPRARAFMLSMGMDSAVINTLLMAPKALRALYDEQVRLGLITREDADAAIEMQKGWAQAEQAAQSLGRTLLTDLAPGLSKVIQMTTDFFVWLRGNPGRIGIVAGFAASPVQGIVASALSYLQNLSRQKKQEQAPPAPASGGGVALRLKPGAAGGPTAPGLDALASSLQRDIPGLSQFTALNDASHKGTGSKHEQGLALDFTVKDPAQYAAVAEQVRAKLRAMGVNAYVQDEKYHPSARSTGPHIHVQFQSAGDAARYGAGAAANAVSGGSTSHTSATTNIGTINVNAPRATDAEGIAEGIGPAVRRASFAGQANYGQN